MLRRQTVPQEHDLDGQHGTGDGCDSFPWGRPLTERALSGEVAQFLAEHISAPEQLDILVLLHLNPDRSWTAAEVSKAVYTVPTAATIRLDELVSHGLVSADGAAEPRYQYAPASAERARRVERVAEAYGQNRAELLKWVLARPRDPAQQFADAFRLRGDNR